jgi:hypothetical protein
LRRCFRKTGLCGWEGLYAKKPRHRWICFERSRFHGSMGARSVVEHRILRRLAGCFLLPLRISKSNYESPSSALPEQRFHSATTTFRLSIHSVRSPIHLARPAFPDLPLAKQTLRPLTPSSIPDWPRRLPASPPSHHLPLPLRFSFWKRRCCAAVQRSTGCYYWG